MVHFLQHRPLLLLFGVAALGYLFGQLRVLGFSLGVSAVLFAGLAVGWALPGAELPDFVAQLGLVLFVYTIGITSGPGFFASLRLRGLRDNALALGVLLMAWLAALLLGRSLGLGAPVLSGVFSGALNNTPALAAAAETLKAGGASAHTLSTAVLAYSICYPIGVLVPLLAVAYGDRIFGVSYATETVSRAYRTQSEEPIANVTARVDFEQSGTARQLRKTLEYTVTFGRIRRGALTSIVRDETQFLAGDLVTVVGTHGNVAAAVAALGRVTSEHIELDRSEVNFRRMFVSNSNVTERPLRELHLIQKYDAVITRVRRGDVDLVPDGDFELMLGDRARVVAPQSHFAELERLFGDSARRVSEIDIITFGLGIALGLVLGAVEVPVPWGGQFSLGIAGGPLLAGLVLGRLGRSGPLVWTPPYGANLTLRQLGMVLFLAGVGIKAGSSLGASALESSALASAAAGFAVAATSVVLALCVGHRLLRIPLGVMVGTLAGIHTQPAVLAFAVEKTKKELPNVGYATVFPLAMITKILLAQLLLQLVHW